MGADELILQGRVMFWTGMVTGWIAMTILLGVLVVMARQFLRGPLPAPPPTTSLDDLSETEKGTGGGNADPS